MKDDLLWELLSLKLSGEATPEELEQLSELIKSDPGVLFKTGVLQRIWQDNKETETSEETQEAFSKHLQRLSNHFANPALQYEANSAIIAPVKRWNKKSLWIGLNVAAIVVFVVVLVYIFSQRTTYKSPSQNVVATKPGSKSKITLPDGTQVWLNADSKITYNGEFGKTFREIDLVGEAYFDVVKDKTHPFIIHTRSMDVKVIGTAFNVRSYPNERTAETSLIRGVVEVILNDQPDKKIILKPNEKLVIQIQPDAKDIKKNHPAGTDNTPILVLEKLHYYHGDSSSVETSWVKNKLVFDEASLENVAKEIERWYDVKITIADDRLKNETYTSVFEEESLPEVMQALQLTGNFKYTINRKEITITR